MGNAQKRRQRSKSKAKRARQQKSGAKSRTPKIPDAFGVAYASPEVLEQAGPLVAATWLVPTSLEEQLKANGRTVPKPVSGSMLVDTGSSHTCISKEVAEKELGLRATGVITTRGVGGEHENPVYLARFVLEIRDENGMSTQIEREEPVMGVPELEKSLSQSLRKAGRPMKLIGLLGRDFLKNATLTYDGVKAEIKIKLHLEKLSPAKR